MKNLFLACCIIFFALASTLLNGMDSIQTPLLQDQDQTPQEQQVDSLVTSAARRKLKLAARAYQSHKSPDCAAAQNSLPAEEQAVPTPASIPDSSNLQRAAPIKQEQEQKKNNLAEKHRTPPTISKVVEHQSAFIAFVTKQITDPTLRDSHIADGNDCFLLAIKNQWSSKSINIEVLRLRSKVRETARLIHIMSGCVEKQAELAG